jgi:hypothetical protein
MLIILTIILITLFFLRVYYFDLAKQKTINFLGFFRGTFAFQYLFPLNVKGLKINERVGKISNLFLYAFYIIFLIIIFYGIMKYGIK